VVADLKKQSKPVSGKEDIANVASISANNDREIGQIMANAMDQVGKDGVITVEEGKSLETYVDVVEGCSLTAAPVAQLHQQTRRHDRRAGKAAVLVYEDKISSASKLIPLLEKIRRPRSRC